VAIGAFVQVAQAEVVRPVSHAPDVASPVLRPKPLADHPSEFRTDRITPREACHLAGMVLAFVQYNHSKAPFCNAARLDSGCNDIMQLSAGATQFLTADQQYALQRRVPGIVAEVYGCLRKINDARLNAAVRAKELLLKKKQDVVRASCDAIGLLAKSGDDSPSLSDVDFVNPCGSLFRASEARANSCLRGGSDVCKALTGQIELENLIPPGIYEASVAKHLPLELPSYVQASLDGSLDVLKNKSVGAVNDLVSRRIVAKAGSAGSIALATITQASKQIGMALEHGNNDWARCLGTDNLGACFHKIFAGGVPESAPLARPKTVNGKEQIDCCYCKQELYRTDGILRNDLVGSWGDTKLRTDDYLSPIENGEFGKSLCYAQQGKIRDLYSAQSEGFSVYFRLRGCAKVTVTGRSCVLQPRQATEPPLTVLSVKALEPPKPPRQSDGAVRMDQRRDEPPSPDDGPPVSVADRLYAPGDRPDDPKPTGARFDELYRLPVELAPRPYSWRPAPGPRREAMAPPAPLDLARFHRAAHVGRLPLPDPPGLRAAARPPRQPALPVVAPPVREAVKLDARAPEMALPELPAPRERRAPKLPDDLAMAPLAPVPPHEDELPLVAPPEAAKPAPTLPMPDVDVRTHTRPVVPPAGEPPTRSALPPLPLVSAIPALEVPLPDAPHRQDTRPALDGPPPPSGPVADVAPPRSTGSPASAIGPSRPRPAPPQTSPAASPCTCTKEWSTWHNNERWALCVVRKEGRPLLHSRFYLEDPNCQSSCSALYGNAAVAAQCASVGSSAGLPSTAAPAAQVVRPSPQSPPNRCVCRQEWSAWQNQQRTLLCVLRRDGSPLLSTLSYVEDPGCRNACQTLWRDSRSQGCFR
jgi:hypothetical protein